MSGAIEIPASLDGERVDRAVALVSGQSRAEVAGLIARGGVRIGGEVVTSRHRRVQKGELLELDLVAAPSEPVPVDVAGVIAYDVVLEDESVVVVDKPAGLVVHPGAGHVGDTLVSGLLARYPDLAAAARAGAGDPERPGIVHRLDKDTSGLLVVARTPEAYEALVAQLADRSMGRTYLALVLGNVVADEGTVDAPIGRSARQPTRMTVSTTGKPARSHYRVLRRFSEPVPTTLLEVVLETGRTHQIRVHLAAIGHPVAGDTRYGGTARPLRLERPFLHAARLRFTHPVHGGEVALDSALPPDLATVLERLS